MSDRSSARLPFYFSGTVTTGFGRGSKELGCPTANLNVEAFRDLDDRECGVYYGWAAVADGPVLPSVLSIGYNPHFENTAKTLEVHVLRTFPRDFYGSELKLVVCGFIRQMLKFSSLQELIDAIESDKAIARRELLTPAMATYARDPFFAMDRKVQRACVYCGSSDKSAPFMAAGSELGSLLAARGIGLVYGGGSAGIMGAVARAVHAGGASVLGVIPKALAPKAVSGDTVGETVVVDSMHVRKTRMATEGDLFIALPGGFGTLEELFEIITWAQLGIHRKPIGVLNTDGYYAGLVAMVEAGLAHGLIAPEFRALLVVAATPAELVDRLLAHRMPYGLDLNWSPESL
eukprot:c4573_g1_i2.p1 GENE.c4573_g1_i2~~c4573_g1_i2.p1  ORF type:complete len:347 (+),score=68.66 c4573_g1_i2:86-1126(+)